MLSKKLFKAVKKTVYQPSLSLSNGHHPIRLASSLYVLAGLFCLTACASAAATNLNVQSASPSASSTATPLPTSLPTAIVVYIPSPVSTPTPSPSSPAASANEVSPSPTVASTAVPIVEPSPEPTPIPSQVSTSPTPFPTPTPTASPVSASASAMQTLSPSDQILMDAFKNKTSNLQVQGSGSVSRILADDNDGSRHQRFIVKLASGQTLLVAHNIDLAPKITTIKINQPIEFFGEYEWNDQGGVIHWTHKDPQQKHIDGWLKYQGTKYE